MNRFAVVAFALALAACGSDKSKSHPPLGSVGLHQHGLGPFASFGADGLGGH